MKKHLLAAITAFGIISSALVACNSQKSATAQNNSCDSQAKPVRTATNESGVFVRDEPSGKYAIRVVIPNTIDEQHVYLICNPPSELPQTNAQVTFSGTVRASKQTSNLGGLTYYDVEITALK